jgi:hypothetical protein
MAEINAKDETLIKNVHDSMDNLGKSIIWISFSLVIISLPVLSKDFKGDSNIKLFGLEISGSRAGLLMFGVLFFINLYIYRLFSTIVHAYQQISDKERIRFILQRHPLIANPFAKSLDSGATPTDLIGYPVYFLLWWAAFALALRLSFLSDNKIVNFAILIFSLLYFWIGLSTGWIIKFVLPEITPSLKRKRLTFAALIVGIIIVVIINWNPAYNFLFPNHKQ